MNRLFFLLAGVWCLSSAVLLTAGPIEIPSVSVTALTGSVATLQGQMVTVTGAVATIQGTLATATGNVGVLQGYAVALSDTNVTTTATTHTPRFIGDVLVGGAGAGTNAVWIAKGATSNDWISVKP